MGDIPTTVNGAANTVNGIINFTVFGVAITAAKTYARAEMPFLNAPVISQIFDYVMDKVGTFLYTFLSQFWTFTIIDSQVAGELNGVTAAEGRLRSAHLTGDEHAIDVATEEYGEELGRLVHWDGSASNAGHG